MLYGKLCLKLASKGLELNAKVLKSFCYGKLMSINVIDVDGDYCVQVYPKYKSSQTVYFENLRQVQRWFDKNMRDEFLPTIKLKDGTRKAQHKSW